MHLSCLRNRPQFAAMSQVKEITERPFTVTNERGEKLSCLISSAAELRARAKVLILCHGHTGSKRATLVTQLCSGLLNKLPPEYAVVRFDFSGNGHSDGVFQYANYTQEAIDLRAVVLAVRAMRYHVEAIAGHSKAATDVLLYAAKYADVPNLINLAGRWNMKRGIAERFGERAMHLLQNGHTLVKNSRRCGGDGTMIDFQFQLTMEQLRERLDMDMNAVVRALPHHVNVLIVHGEQDDVIPVQDGRHLHQAISNSSLVVVQHADHSFSHKETQVVDAIVSFLRA